MIGWLNADEAAVPAFVLKLHVASDEREEGVILALADVFSGLMLRAALPDENGARVDELSAETLHTQPLTVRIAAVC